MKYTFPALFKEDPNDPGYIIISFPDLIGIGSEAKEGEEMIYAQEILELALSIPHRRLVNPTAVAILKERYPDYEVRLVTVDIFDQFDLVRSFLLFQESISNCI